MTPPERHYPGRHQIIFYEKDYFHFTVATAGIAGCKKESAEIRTAETSANANGVINAPVNCTGNTREYNLPYKSVEFVSPPLPLIYNNKAYVFRHDPWQAFHF